MLARERSQALSLQPVFAELLMTSRMKGKGKKGMKDLPDKSTEKDNSVEHCLIWLSCKLIQRIVRKRTGQTKVGKGQL